MGLLLLLLLPVTVWCWVVLDGVRLHVALSCGAM